MNAPDTIQRTIHLNQSHAGRRFDQVAAELFGDFSRSRLQHWIRQGQLTLNGKTVTKPNYKVTGVERVELFVEITAHADDQPQAIPLEIAYEDKSLLIVNKPAGMVVHPAAGNPDNTLVNALLYFDDRLASLPRAGIVHRLDKQTSGLLLVARTDPVRLALIELLKIRKIQRYYMALVWGRPPAGGTIATAFGRHPVDRLRMSVRPDSDQNAKPAVTHFSLLQQYVDCAFLSVKLDTGRTHQIRVHMTHTGHPLVGDSTYRQHRPQMTDSMPDELVHFPRQALHATRLQFIHPVSAESIDVVAELPDDMQALLDVLVSEAGAG